MSTYMIDQDRPLIFTHMPKTGGMSLFASLAEYYGTRIADMYNLSAYQPNNQAEALLKDDNMCVYAGHFSFGLHEWLNRPSCYMAVVRHPIARIQSLYRYSIQYREQVRQARKIGNRTTMQVFSDGDAADFYIDFLPWIDGSQSLSSFLNCPSPELDNGMVRRFSGYGLDPAPCPHDALEQAKQNIDSHYTIVGLLERFPETINLIRSAFSWNLTPFHVNRGSDPTKKQGRLPVDLRRKIKSMNALDLALYDWLEARFDAALDDSVKALVIEGGGRTDYENIKLWRAIGSSPIRRAVMEKSPERHKPSS